MKFAAVFFLAFVAAAVAGPISVSDNNIGDIVSVGISGKIDISNEIDQTLVNVIIAALNRQGIEIVPTDEQAGEAPKMNITPEMIEKFKGLLAKH